jgi:hypothetical protein
MKMGAAGFPAHPPRGGRDLSEPLGNADVAVVASCRVALVAITILCLAYFGFGIVDLIRRPEWAFEPSQAQIIKARLSNSPPSARKRITGTTCWPTARKPGPPWRRSPGCSPKMAACWSKTYSHSAKPDNTAGQAKVGFVKEWKITGFARDEALEYLNTLNTREGINAHFSEIARVTGNEPSTRTSATAASR